MTEDAERTRRRRRSRHAQIRAEVAAEETEAAEAEAAENAGTLEVPLHLRITRALDAELRDRAATEQIPTSALVRRLLSHATRPAPPALTEDDVEQIARRVVNERVAPESTPPPAAAGALHAAAGVWEIYLDDAGQYRIRLLAAGGEVAAGGPFPSKQAAREGIESIKRTAGHAELSDLSS